MSAKTQAALKLKPLHLPAHERHELANGLAVHVVPRGPLPLVAVRLVVRGGSAFDPHGKFGLADFAARLLRRGAKGKTADEISEAVEFVGAAVGGHANEESVVVSLATPAKYFEPMMEMVGELVTSPDYPAQEVELARRRTIGQIANELDDPGALADRAITRGVWGDHPYGHETVGHKRDLEALTREDLTGWHRQHLGPRISNLYVVGDVRADTVLPVVQRAFGHWSGGPEFAPRVPDWGGPARAGDVIIVDKPEQTQVQVRIGARGVKRGHAEHFPLVVMNTALGGSFTSRLMTEIRVKRGLSYGAGCAFDMLTTAGAFGISSFTKTDSVETLIDVALAEVKKMREKGPLAREVATVQRYIAGLYPARLETNDAVAGALADIIHYGLPENWVDQYRERIAAPVQRREGDRPGGQRPGARAAHGALRPRQRAEAGRPGVTALTLLTPAGATGLVAVDKPAGMLVVPGRADTGPTVRAALEAQLGRPVWVCHRLDRDTSGVVVFALDAQAHRAASMAFEAGEVSKRYLALAAGKLEQPALVEVPLVEGRKRTMRPARPGESGKPAATQVTPKQVFRVATLVEAEPRTGRQHQIRVHLRALGHPLLFDHQYGRKQPWTGDEVVLARTPLHAASVAIPSLGFSAAAPLPADLARCLELLEASQ
jgi:zinc protease